MKQMKCGKRKVVIDTPFLRSLVPVTGFENEVGGGINFTGKGKVKDVYYFTSDDEKKIRFDKKFDVEFHTHPRKSGRPVRIGRRASAADIASFFVSNREEIIFSEMYTFVLTIVDRNLFERTKRLIRADAKKRKKKFNIPFEMYLDFFQRKESEVQASSRSTREMNEKWHLHLQQYGVLVKRVSTTSNEGIELSIHGRCK